MIEGSNTVSDDLYFMHGNTFETAEGLEYKQWDKIVLNMDETKLPTHFAADGSVQTTSLLRIMAHEMIHARFDILDNLSTTDFKEPTVIKTQQILDQITQQNPNHPGNAVNKLGRLAYYDNVATIKDVLKTQSGAPLKQFLDPKLLDELFTVSISKIGGQLVPSIPIDEREFSYIDAQQTPYINPSQVQIEQLELDRKNKTKVAVFKQFDTINSPKRNLIIYTPHQGQGNVPLKIGSDDVVISNEHDAKVIGLDRNVFFGGAGNDHFEGRDNNEVYGNTIDAPSETTPINTIGEVDNAKLRQTIDRFKFSGDNNRVHVGQSIIGFSDKVRFDKPGENGNSIIYCPFNATNGTPVKGTYFKHPIYDNIYIAKMPNSGKLFMAQLVARPDGGHDVHISVIRVKLDAANNEVWRVDNEPRNLTTGVVTIEDFKPLNAGISLEETSPAPFVISDQIVTILDSDQRIKHANIAARIKARVN